MVQEGIIDKKSALLRINAAQLDQLLHKQIDPAQKAQARKVAQGLPASPGAASGQAVFDAETANPYTPKICLDFPRTEQRDVLSMHGDACEAENF